MTETPTETYPPAGSPQGFLFGRFATLDGVTFDGGPQPEYVPWREVARVELGWAEAGDP